MATALTLSARSVSAARMRVPSSNMNALVGPRKVFRPAHNGGDPLSTVAGPGKQRPPEPASALPPKSRTEFSGLDNRESHAFYRRRPILTGEITM